MNMTLKIILGVLPEILSIFIGFGEKVFHIDFHVQTYKNFSICKNLPVQISPVFVILYAISLFDVLG
jgi:hypothetical protein